MIKADLNRKMAPLHRKKYKSRLTRTKKTKDFLAREKVLIDGKVPEDKVMSYFSLFITIN